MLPNGRMQLAVDVRNLRGGGVRGVCMQAWIFELSIGYRYSGSRQLCRGYIWEHLLLISHGVWMASRLHVPRTTR